MLKCEYCESEFKTISSLNLHKKTAKYCIKKQKSILLEENQDEETKIKKIENICKFCGKLFSRNYMKTHVLSCNSYYEHRIQELEKLVLEKDLEIKKLSEEKDSEIKKLQEENIILRTENSVFKEERVEDRQHIKEMNKIPITVNTNNISNSNNSNNTNNTNNTHNMYINNIIEDISKIEEKLDNLNINHVINGQKGIANFAYQYLCTDEENNRTYLCTDPSRGIFKFINDSGSVIKDISAKTLVRNLCKAGLVLKANNIAHLSYTDENGLVDKSKFDVIFPKTVEINEIERNNSAFKNELATYTS